jgi:putative transposase
VGSECFGRVYRLLLCTLFQSRRKWSVAFVIDLFARHIVGWRVSRSARSHFVRSRSHLAEASVEPSVGSVGDSYDNALVATINGLYKTEVVCRCGPWKILEAVEFAVLDWGDWFNNRRLLEPIRNIPPAEAEARYCAQTEQPAIMA